MSTAASVSRLTRYIKGGTWYEREAYEAFFHGADTDNDGYMTYSDLKAFLRKQNYTGPDTQISRCFSEVDKKNDKKMHLDEFMLAMGLSPHKPKTSSVEKVMRIALLKQIFTMFDKNGDGSIDKGELGAVFKELGNHLPQKEVERIMAEADKDKSGKLNYDEFIRSMDMGHI